MSTDHDWNPRVQLFVGSGDLVELGEAIEGCLRRDLPREFRGRPVSVEVLSVEGYFEEQLAIDVGGEIEARDWLALPEHGRRMFTAGECSTTRSGCRRCGIGSDTTRATCGYTC